MTRRRRRTNPVRHVRRRRRNPSTRTNPGGGISGIVTGGVYIGLGMWAGGLIQGFIPQFGSGLIMDLARGLASAYVVGMIGSRFTGQAGLMAAGAFAPTAVGVIQSVMGGGLSSITGMLGGGGSKHVAPSQAAVAPTGPANVLQMPNSQVG